MNDACQSWDLLLAGEGVVDGRHEILEREIDGCRGGRIGGKSDDCPAVEGSHVSFGFAQRFHGAHAVLFARRLAI